VVTVAIVIFVTPSYWACGAAGCGGGTQDEATGARGLTGTGVACGRPEPLQAGERRLSGRDAAPLGLSNHAWGPRHLHRSVGATHNTTYGCGSPVKKMQAWAVSVSAACCGASGRLETAWLGAHREALEGS
jgi:hypothetical protein